MKAEEELNKEEKERGGEKLEKEEWEEGQVKEKREESQIMKKRGPRRMGKSQEKEEEGEEEGLGKIEEKMEKKELKDKVHLLHLQFAEDIVHFCFEREESFLNLNPISVKFQFLFQFFLPENNCSYKKNQSFLKQSHPLGLIKANVKFWA